MREITPAEERAIVKDYVTTGLSLVAIAAKYGISVNRLTRIRKRAGVRRYMTRKMMGTFGAMPDKKRRPKRRRCDFCQGMESLAAPHQHGAAA